jgi:hypothetical protein
MTSWQDLYDRWKQDGPNMGPIRGRCIGGHYAVCPRCGSAYAHTFVVSDDPLVEETRCSRCDRVHDINGRPVPLPDEMTMVGDGEGRR